MCTCIMLKNVDTFFGRNMDLNYSFNEKIIIVPRYFKLNFKIEKPLSSHYAFIGIGCIIDNYPLFAEASNEKGLSIAALNFQDNAFYHNIDIYKRNLAPYELFTYLLAKFSTVDEVKTFLKKANIINVDFNADIKVTPLHFMISDKNASIVVESTKNGLNVYDNPYNVLTNNPSFPYHVENIKNYLNLSIDDPIDSLKLDLKPFSYGQGLIGLPGDYSSASRFVKTLFIKNNMSLITDEKDTIRQFFYCLESVKMIIGLVKTKEGYEYSRYTSCFNVNKSILYYKKYEGNIINKVDMNSYDINKNKLISIKMIDSFIIK